MTGKFCTTGRSLERHLVVAREMDVGQEIKPCNKGNAITATMAESCSASLVVIISEMCYFDVEPDSLLRCFRLRMGMLLFLVSARTDLEVSPSGLSRSGFSIYRACQTRSFGIWSFARWGIPGEDYLRGAYVVYIRN